jgi:hypothetical protein
MRTNINLDDDVHQFASIYARAKGVSLSAAINDLMRKVEKIPKPKPELCKSRVTGLPCFPSRGGRVTTEMVRKLEDDDD